MASSSKVTAFQSALTRASDLLSLPLLARRKAPDAQEGQAALDHLQKIATDFHPENKPYPTLRCIHHLACTGGTLLSRAIAAQPNVTLLSEVDPLSPLAHKHPFVPTDLIGLAKFGSRPASQETQLNVFQAGMSVLQKASEDEGNYLVLRNHAHGKYNFGPKVQERPSLRDVLSDRYKLIEVVTVRNPVDSFLALEHNNWVSFQPANFDEYCRRYFAFLDDHAELSVFRYEDFVNSPVSETERLCDALTLPFNAEFEKIMQAIEISGNSGRRGAEIALRPRRNVSEEFLAICHKSEAYKKLCERLGYPIL